MKFRLETARDYYSNDIHNVKRLTELGFTFDKSEEVGELIIKGSPMVCIETLEELIDFAKEWGEIIVSEGTIIIYDGFVE